ncbi:DUF551 domain-containing protein [Escherichia coli]|uniref:DUF551 domain-containing protein n=1 Tax=Escherichia coli TaxID=562 RepID=UPI002FC69521
MSEINYQEGHETAGQAKPVAWRYRYVKKGVTDSQGKSWFGDWKYVPTKEDCNDRPNYEIQALFTAPPATVVPEFETWFNNQESGRSICSTQIRRSLQEISWNACCAAMLQGKSEQPQNAQQNIPENIPGGNSPVTPDGWISCSERMPPQDDWILIYSKHGEYMAGQVQGEYVELSDGTLSWLGNALYWMPLPEPPQEMK